MGGTTHGHPEAGHAPVGEADPSMDDILASIRRILSDDEAAEAASPQPRDAEPGVLLLDPAMMVHEPDHEPAPPAHAEPMPMSESVHVGAASSDDASGAGPLPEHASLSLVDTATHAAASSAMGALVRTLNTARSTAVHRGGPTLEDMVRDEMRPLLKEWLDANLSPLVERLVQAEIERVIKASA